MNYPAPVLLVIGPLLASVVTLFLGRWRRVVVLMGAVTAWWLWLWLMSVPLEVTAAESTGRLFVGDAWSVADRAFVLTEGIQAVFLFLYLALSVLFLLSWFFPQGQAFVPGSLAVFSFLSASLMVRPLTYGVLFLLAAMAILAIIVQAERVGSTRAAWRYLLMGILIVPLFMVAGWALETEQARLMVLVSRLLVAGFIILLAGFPFHIWVNPVVSQAPPLASVLIFSLVQLGIVAFVFNWLAANPWLGREMHFVQIVRWSGAVTVVLAGLAAVTAATAGRLLGSLLLLDMSMALLALSLPGPIRLPAIVSLQVIRFFTLLPAIVGLMLLRRQTDSDEIEANKGLGRRAPRSLALFVFGCLSLLGLPLTVGFGSRWAVITAVAQQATSPAPWLSLLLLLAMVGGTAGVLRGLAYWLQPATEVDVAPTAVERPWLHGALALVLVAGLWLALFPQVLLSYAARLADLLA